MPLRTEWRAPSRGDCLRRFQSVITASHASKVALHPRAHYDILERTQRSSLDVTGWIDWFLGCLGRAIDGAQTTLAAVLRKAHVCDILRDVPIKERQRMMLNRLLDGFGGQLTTSKWAPIAKCSTDTTLRDILDLVEHGVLIRNHGGGRSTSYSLAAIG